MPAPNPGDVPVFVGPEWSSASPMTLVISLAGDVTGTTTASSVVKWQGVSLDAATMATPGDAQLAIYRSGTGSWHAVSLSGGATVDNTGVVTLNTGGLTIAGDVTGTLAASTVAKINGATAPVSGALVVGNVLQVSGVSALSYGPLNLAGGASYVTGLLPFTNLGSTSSATFGTNANSQQAQVIDHLSTTNATPATFAVAVFACPDLTSIDVVVTVLAKTIGSSDTFCQDYRARYFRNGGALTLIASVILGANPIGTGGLSTASATLVISGNSVEIQVTGVAATSINWSATMQVQQVQ